MDSGMILWKVIAGLAAALLVLVFICVDRGRRIDGLKDLVKSKNAEIAALKRDYAGLQSSARAARAAAEAHSLTGRIHLERIVRIEKIVGECVPVPRPEEAVNAESSREVVDFLNRDIFQPFGRVRDQGAPDPPAAYFLFDPG